MFYPFLVKNATLYVIQTTEGRKNLVYIHFVFPRFFANALNDKCFRDFTVPKFGQNPFLFFLVFSFCGGVCTNMPTRFFYFMKAFL